MARNRSKLNEHWSSKWAFIFAAAGSAIGLGNIWKFPYITGANGGGAFVLIYLLCVLLIGIPILIAEIYIGRLGDDNPVDGMLNIIKNNKLSRLWVAIGWLAVIGSFLILSYYCVIAGWTLDYTVKSINGAFTHMTPMGIDNMFTALLAHPAKLIFYFTIFIALTGYILSQGISKGIEKAIFVLFPVLLIILIALVIYAIDTGFFVAGLKFLFQPDFSKINASSVLTAMGHAFFTLSLGMGAMMMYGAYLPKKYSIPQAAAWIAFIDTAIALLSGLAIFPIVFAHGLDAGAGPGLIFKTLPLAFAKLPYGHLFASLFFIMLAIAALTSTISLLEPSIAFLLKRTKLKRVQATMLACAATWIVGLCSLLSFNLLANVKFFMGTFFNNIDYLTTNMMLPTNAFLISLFVVWGIKRKHVQQDLMMTNVLHNIWYNVIKYFSPLAIIIVLISTIAS